MIQFLSGAIARLAFLWRGERKRDRLESASFTRGVPTNSHPFKPANYLKDLRTNRPARPTGSRPLPGKSSTSTSDLQDGLPPRAASAFSMYRQNSPRRKRRRPASAAPYRIVAPPLMLLSPVQLDVLSPKNHSQLQSESMFFHLKSSRVQLLPPPCPHIERAVNVVMRKRKRVNYVMRYKI